MGVLDELRQAFRPFVRVGEGLERFRVQQEPLDAVLPVRDTPLEERVPLGQHRLVAGLVARTAGAHPLEHLGELQRVLRVEMHLALLPPRRGGHVERARQPQRRGARGSERVQEREAELLEERVGRVPRPDVAMGVVLGGVAARHEDRAFAARRATNQHAFGAERRDLGVRDHRVPCACLPEREHHALGHEPPERGVLRGLTKGRSGRAEVPEDAGLHGRRDVVTERDHEIRDGLSGDATVEGRGRPSLRDGRRGIGHVAPTRSQHDEHEGHRRGAHASIVSSTGCGRKQHFELEVRITPSRRAPHAGGRSHEGR